MLDGRWDRDYFAGSIQSYLNPIAYIPIYYFVVSETPDFLVAIFLTLPALASAWILWSIAEKTVPASNRDFPIIFLMVSLGITSSLWLIVTGSTFTDGLTCAITLWSLNILLSEKISKNNKLIFSGLLIGLSTGIKLTNGTYAVSLVASYFFLARKETPRIIIKNLIILCSAITAGFLITHGYWSWKLWMEFKNPFFPFFNELFKSPDFPAVNLQDQRFMGDSWAGIFTLPFRMPRIEPWIYSEASAPEIKAFAFSIIFPLFITPYLILRKSKIPEFKKESANSLLFITIFLLISYLTWSLSSRIGRYAIFIWVTLGTLIIAWIFLIFGKKIARICGLCLLIVQCFFNANAQISHWAPVSWGGAWFKPEIPAVLKENPHTILTAGLQTYSAIAPFTHEKSRWSSVYGQNTLPWGQNIPLKLRKNIDQGDVFSITPSLFIATGTYTGPTAIERELISSLFLAYGLEPRNFDCAPILIKNQTLFTWQNNKKDNTTLLHACRLYPANKEIAKAAQMRMQYYDDIFTAIENKCPALFSPKGTNSALLGNEVSRFYFNTSIHLYSEENLIISRPPQQMLRHVVAKFDPNSLKISSEIVCHTYPKKLHLN